jgi:protein-disulfide isomerase
MRLMYFKTVFLLATFALNMEAADDTATATSQTDQILSELREIRALLDKQSGAVFSPASTIAKSIEVSLSGEPFLGDIKAPITVVEFTDYECPFCRNFRDTVFKDIKRLYIDSGRVRFYVRNRPLEMHPFAPQAAEAVICARDQGYFWEMHDLLTDANHLDEAQVLQFARGIHLEPTRFAKCLIDRQHRTDVETEVAGARKIGIEATPSFIVGISSADGVTGNLLVGALPLSIFEEQFEKLLK